MRPSPLFRVSLLACGSALVVLSSLQLIADDGAKAGGAATKPAAPAMPGGMDEAAMMAAWQKYATPGAEHAELAEWAGDWTLEMEDLTPGMGNAKSPGTAKCTMIMGGRYLLEEVKGVTMGMPFEGMSITGYDNQQQRFVTTWIDSVGTGIATSSGTKASADVMQLTGEMTCPMTEEPLKTRATVTAASDDKRMMEMQMAGPDGAPMGAFRITYTRQK